VTQEPGDAVPDGMKVDSAGNVYATGPGGMLVISPREHLGLIEVPEIPANCVWGEADGKTPYIAARTGVYPPALPAAEWLKPPSCRTSKVFGRHQIYSA
jgi:gluconolactonase